MPLTGSRDVFVTCSDQQSGHYSIRQLERIRDDNLVDMMQALKARNWGAGLVLQEHDECLRES
jgi:carnitine 3-dehydrogenase